MRAATISIPREVFVLCALAPVLTAPLLEPQLHTLSWLQIARNVLANYVPFLGIPLLLRFVYARLVPDRVYDVSQRWWRFALHFAITTGSALVAALLFRSLHLALRGVPCPWWAWLAVCVIMTWFFMLPTVLVQELRAHAERAEKQARAARTAALEAQLEALQARTNPHFLFNGINTVASLIGDDPVRAEETLVRLAEIMRYSLEGSRSRLVPLSRELAVVRDYLEVQSARFGARLRFRIEVEPDAEHVSVPPLCLQTLVENAVLHGVGSRREGGEVQVLVHCAAGRAHIEVLDDGLGPGASNHHGSGTALKDLERRLALLYGKAGSLESGERPSGGYRVCVTLPTTEVA